MSQDKSKVSGEVINKNKYPVNYWRGCLNHTFQVLRARLLNLADSVGSDEEQRKAIKGLIKDFCNDAYYPLKEDIGKFLQDYGIEDNSDESFIWKE